MAKRGRRLGYKASKETLDKMRETRARNRVDLGKRSHSRRGTEDPKSEVPQELNDTRGSPGWRIMPKFDTSDKP